MWKKLAVACACALGTCCSFGCAGRVAVPALVLRAAATSYSSETSASGDQRWQWLLSAGLAFRPGKDPLRSPGLPEAEPVSGPDPGSVATCEVPALCSWEQQAGDSALAQLDTGGV